MASIQPLIHPVFEDKTSTWQYIVACPKTKKAVIIDSVLDFDSSSSTISSTSAENLLSLIAKEGYTVTHILETHAHADHITASRYLQQRLFHLGHPNPKICIGKRILQVQKTFASKYDIDEAELVDVFDLLLDDDMEFSIGELTVRVLYLPGHTPDHVGYLIGENVFTGDSIFNPDVGSARCDFPGGDTHALFSSMQRLLALPLHFKLYTGHDYPPAAGPVAGEGQAAGRGPEPYYTVEEQKAHNKHVGRGAKETEFTSWRTDRDSQLGEPRLLHQSLQMNIRAGRLPKISEGGHMFLHLPLKVPSSVHL